MTVLSSRFALLAAFLSLAAVSLDPSFVNAAAIDTRRSESSSGTPLSLPLPKSKSSKKGEDKSGKNSKHGEDKKKSQGRKHVERDLGIEIGEDGPKLITIYSRSLSSFHGVQVKRGEQAHFHTRRSHRPRHDHYHDHDHDHNHDHEHVHDHDHRRDVHEHKHEHKYEHIHEHNHRDHHDHDHDHDYDHDHDHDHEHNHRRSLRSRFRAHPRADEPETVPGWIDIMSDGKRIASLDCSAEDGDCEPNETNATTLTRQNSTSSAYSSASQTSLGYVVNFACDSGGYLFYFNDGSMQCLPASSPTASCKDFFYVDESGQVNPMECNSDGAQAAAVNPVDESDEDPDASAQVANIIRDTPANNQSSSSVTPVTLVFKPLAQQMQVQEASLDSSSDNATTTSALTSSSTTETFTTTITVTSTATSSVVSATSSPTPSATGVKVEVFSDSDSESGSSSTSVSMTTDSSVFASSTMSSISASSTMTSDATATSSSVDADAIASSIAASASTDSTTVTSATPSPTSDASSSSSVTDSDSSSSTSSSVSPSATGASDGSDNSGLKMRSTGVYMWQFKRD